MYRHILAQATVVLLLAAWAGIAQPAVCFGPGMDSYGWSPRAACTVPVPSFGPTLDPEGWFPTASVNHPAAGIGPLADPLGRSEVADALGRQEIPLAGLGPTADPYG
jgi:hypothetical protein